MFVRKYRISYCKHVPMACAATLESSVLQQGDWAQGASTPALQISLEPLTPLDVLRETQIIFKNSLVASVLLLGWSLVTSRRRRCQFSSPVSPRTLGNQFRSTVIALSIDARESVAIRSASRSSEVVANPALY